MYRCVCVCVSVYYSLRIASAILRDCHCRGWWTNKPVAVYTGLSTKPVNPSNSRASHLALLNLPLIRIIRLVLIARCRSSRSSKQLHRRPYCRPVRFIYPCDTSYTVSLYYKYIYVLYYIISFIRIRYYRIVIIINRAVFCDDQQKKNCTIDLCTYVNRFFFEFCSH